MPIREKVVEVLRLKKSPRLRLQLLSSCDPQPLGRTAQKAEPDVEGSRRTVWGGVPIWTTKEDHVPSSEFSLVFGQRSGQQNMQLLTAHNALTNSD